MRTVENRCEMTIAILSSALTGPQRKLAMDALAFIQDKSAADAMIELAGTQGFLDAIDVKDVTRYEAAMLSYLRSEHGDLLGKIRDTKALDDDTAKALKDALTAFGKQFA